MTNREGNACVRCGQDLRLAESEWHFSPTATSSKGTLCGSCVVSLPDEEEHYW